MNPAAWFALGFAAAIALGVLAVLLAWLAGTGASTECGGCGYTTGPRDTTRRIVWLARWRWHRYVITHRAWHRTRARLPYPL